MLLFVHCFKKCCTIKYFSLKNQKSFQGNQASVEEVLSLNLVNLNNDYFMIETTSVPLKMYPLKDDRDHTETSFSEY